LINKDIGFDVEKKIFKIVTVKDPIYGFRDMSESFFYWEELWD
jgi:hypothetical protein